MTSKTNFKTREDFRSELSVVVDELWDDYADATTILTEDLVPIEGQGYHFVSQLLKPPYDSRTKHTLCSLLYRNVYRAEMLSEGAGEVAFISTLYLIKEYLDKDLPLGNEAEVMKDLGVAVEKIRFLIQQISENVTEEHLKKSIDNICRGEPLLADACWEAIHLAGLEGRVFIENGKQDNFVVELKEGYTFGLKGYPFFLNKGKWEARQCKILVVDGFIESVSEIDQLLNEAFDKKQPMALISLGFSEEVISTLYTNFQKKALNVIPLRLMSDIDSLNVINDIGVVCGMDPISSLKGQMLTFVKYETLPVVHRLLVSDKDATIENFKTRQAVFGQIKGLLDKREENRLVEDIQNIIDARIRSLSPNAVLLRLPDMSSFKNDAYRIKLDVALRQCKTLLNYGIIRDHRLYGSLRQDEIQPRQADFCTIVSNEFEDNFFSCVEDITYSTKGPSYSRMSTLCFYAGLMIGSQLAFMLLLANGTVQIDSSS